MSHQGPIAYARRKTAAVLVVLALATPTVLAAAGPDLDVAPPAVDAEASLWWQSLDVDADGDRIDDRIEAQIREAFAAGRADATLDVIADFAYFPTALDVAQLEAFGATDVNALSIIQAATADMPASRIEDYVAATPSLGLLEYSPTLYPTLSVSTKTIKAGPSAAFSPATAWERGYAGHGMVVAVLDTGTNNQHNYFKPVSNGQPKWIAGGAFDGANALCSDPTDGHGHGTHVASTAVGNGGVSAAPYGANAGVAPEAQLVEMQISSGSDGSAATTDIVEAWNWIATWNQNLANGVAPCPGITPAQRIDVGTLSFGSLGDGGSGTGAGEAAINSVVAKGVVAVVAAGNCGGNGTQNLLCPAGFASNTQSIGSPATADGAITVANSEDKNTVARSDDTIAASSSRGPRANDGDANPYDEMKPEITAPGTSIVAASHSSNTGTASMSGTSMAAPHIAGVAALVLQANPLCAPTNKDVHPLRDVLIKSAEYKTATSQTRTGVGKFGRSWNNAWGYGLTDADLAITEALSGNTCDVIGAGLDARPGGPYTATVGEAITLTGSASGGTGPYSISWDLDADGTFETAGATATVAFAADGTWAPKVRAVDATSASDVSAASVVVKNAVTLTESTLRSWNFDAGADEFGVACDSAADGMEQGWFWSRPIFPDTNQAADWHTVSTKTASGTCAWYHGDAVTYGDGQVTDLVSPNTAWTPAEPCIDVPSSYAGARLDFAIAGELELNFDYMYVQVSPGACSDGSGSFSTVAQFTGAHGSLADPPTYVTRSADLGAVVGAGPSQVRFRVVTDIGNAGCEEADPTTAPPEANICTGYEIDSFRLVGLTASGGDGPGAFALSAAAAGSEIHLAWTASDGATAYSVHRAGATGFVPTAANDLGETTGTSFVDASPAVGFNHYVVVASSENGTTASDYASASTSVGDTTPPSAPVLTATDLVTGDDVRLVWTAAQDAESGIAGYVVKRDGVTVAPLSGSALNYDDSGLVTGQAYTYVVEARNGADLVTASNAAVATPTADTTPPAQVTGLTAAATSRQVALDWADNTEADLASYVVRRDGVVLGTRTTSALLDLAVTNGVTYCYTVAAKDAVGNEGLASGEVCATPTAPPVAPIVGWPMARRDPGATGASPEAAFYDSVPLPLGALQLGVVSGPVVGDLDGDGANEVVVAVGTDSNAPMQVVAYRVDESLGQALVELWRTDLPHGLPAHGDGSISVPALIEADGGAGLEVVVSYTYIAGAAGTGAIDGLVALLDGNGAVLATADAPNPSDDSEIVVANLDLDPAFEFVFTNDPSTSTTGASVPTSVSVFEASDGGLISEGAFAAASLVTSSPVAIGDLDGDGVSEIVAPYFTTNAAGGVVIGSPRGAVLKTVALGVGVMGVAIADLDGDAPLEIVATGRTGAQSLVVVDTVGGVSGYASAATAAAGRLWNTAAIGDVDGDGKPEIVLAEHNVFVDDVARAGTVRVYGYAARTLTLEGSVVRQSASEDNRAPTGAVLVDADGDGDLDILVPSRKGLVEAYDGATRAPLWSAKAGGAVVSIALADAWTNLEVDLVLATEGPTGSLMLIGSRNHRAIIEQVADVLANEGDLVAVAFRATDLDGDAIAFSASGVPGGASFTDNGNGTARLAWPTGFLDAGAYTIQVSASDGRSFPTSTTFTVTVANVNRAPVIEAVGPRTGAEGALLRFAVPASDADTDDTLAVTADPLPAGATFTDGAFSWTPDFTQAGAYDVTFSATDGEATAMETVTLTVANTNRAPVFVPVADQAVDVYKGKKVAFTVGASDPDGDYVTLDVVALPTGAGFAIANATFWWYPTTADTGLHQVTFTATDGADAATDVVQVLVTANANPKVKVTRDALSVDTSPGVATTLGFRVRNDGLATDSVAFTAHAPPGWALVLPAPVTLAPGETKRVTVVVTPTANPGSAPIVVTGTSVGGATSQHATSVRLPVTVDLEMEYDTYFLSTPVTGTVVARYMNGAPVASGAFTLTEFLTVNGLSTGILRTKTVTTDADGRAMFAFTVDATGANMPGDHTVVASAKSIANHGSTDKDTYRVV